MKENNEHKILLNRIKLKKDLLLLNSNVGFPKTYRLSRKKSKNNLILSKDILNAFINDSKVIYRNNNILNYKTKKAYLTNNKSILKINEYNKKDNKIKILKNKNKNEHNINKLRKKENIKININNIDNINNYNDEINNKNNENDGKFQESKTEVLLTINSISNSSNNILNKNNNCIYNNRKYNYNRKNIINNNCLTELNDFKNSNLLKPISSMNEIRLICRKKLYQYNSDLKKYHIKIINDIILDSYKHIVSKFKNYLIWNDPNEFLKRYYYLDESECRIKPISLYYIEYTHFFPVYYCNLEIIKILLKNIKRKVNYLKNKENKENNITCQFNSISNYFEEKVSKSSNNINMDNKEKEFIPLIESYYIDKESKISSNNKSSSSLSLTIKYYNEKYGNNDSNKKKNQILIEKRKDNDSPFNINITPIQNKVNNDDRFNDSKILQIKNNNIEINDKKNHELIINKEEIENKKKEDNKIDKIKINSEKKKDKISIQNIKKKDNKKINLKSLRIKVEDINIKLRNKKNPKYIITDYIEMNMKNSEIIKDVIFLKRRINSKEKTNKNKNAKSFNNKEKSINQKSLEIFSKRKGLNKPQINKTTKNINIIDNFNQKNKLFSKKKHITTKILNKNYSLIIGSKNNLKNNVLRLINQNKYNNIISNLNNNYFKLSKYSERSSSNKRINNAISKDNIEFHLRFHSLSSNKKRSLKISGSSKSKSVLKLVNNKYSSYKKHRNHDALFKKYKNTTKRSNKKFIKGNSGIFNKSKNLLINKITHTNENYNILKEIKKSLVINNKGKNRSDLKNKQYIKRVIDIFNNTSNSNFRNYNYNIYTSKNIKKEINNKPKISIDKRKCKSNSPNISNDRNSSLKNKKINLKSKNNYFLFKKELINERNNKNSKYNYISNNISLNENNVDKDRKFDKKRIKKIIKVKIDREDNKNSFSKNPYSPRKTFINNSKSNLNLITQTSFNKKDIKNKIKVEKGIFFKNSIKYWKLLPIKKKYKFNDDSIRNKNKINLKQTRNKTKLNIKTSNKSKKNISIQFNLEKINNNNIIIKKDNSNKNICLNQKIIIIKNKNYKNNITLKKSKIDFNSILSNDFSENLSERNYYCKEDIKNSKNKLNSYSKDKINNKSFNFYNNKKKSSKNKSVLYRNITDKPPNKNSTEKINYKISKTKNFINKKALTNRKSFCYDNHLKKNIDDKSHKNNYKNKFRNKNKEISNNK